MRKIVAAGLLLLRRVVSTDSDFAPILILIAIASFALLWRLGASSLADWDEAIYAQIAKEIVRGRDWLTLHWEYKPWFEKTPLLMWTTALLYKLFGVNEFWARFASAASGIALVVVTYLSGKHIYGKRTGLFAAIILLTSYHFVAYARFGTADMMLTLFTFLSIYAYLRLRDGNQKWLYMIGLSVALALMVKGVAGLLAPVVIALALVSDDRFVSTLQSKHFWRSLVLAVIVAAPWHIVMLMRHGYVFINEYLGYHVIARLSVPLEGHGENYFYYVGKLIDGFFPWCFLIPFAVVSSVKEIRRGESRSRVLLLTSALVFGLYTLIQTKIGWYIIPIYPALAMLIASFIMRIYEARRTRRHLITYACAALVAIGGLYSFLVFHFYVKSDEHIATLARFAASTRLDDTDSLVLFSESKVFDRPAPLFYSNRPLQQAYATSKPSSLAAKRYVDYENLADVTRHSIKRIILPKSDLARLSADYEIEVLAEAGPLVYGTIKRRI